MTARRKAALRKAQLASARARKGKRLSPTGKRRLKKGAIITAGITAAVLVGREVKVSNTYLYARSRYTTMHNYRHLPKVDMERERRHMKHRQRARFSQGRSTFKMRKVRQKYQRDITRSRIRKLGFGTYAYRMSRNNFFNDPIVRYGTSRLKKNGLVRRAGNSKAYKAYDRQRFVRSVYKTLAGMDAL